MIRRVSPDGESVEVVAGTGVEGFIGNGGAAVDAELGWVARVALDGDGLLIADQTNSCIRRLSLAP